MRKILLLSSLLVVVMFLVSCAPGEEAVAGQALRRINPDLTIPVLSYALVPDSTTGGKDVEVTFVVNNTGGSTVVATDYSISATGTLNNFVVQNAVPQLNTRQAVALKYKYSPNTCPHDVTITLDPSNKVVEMYENNNVKQMNVDCTTKTCTDSDGGINSAVKGTISYSYGVVFNSQLQLWKKTYILGLPDAFGIPDDGTDVDVCTKAPYQSNSDNRIYVAERYCDSTQDINATTLVECPNGCSDGACI